MTALTTDLFDPVSFFVDRPGFCVWPEVTARLIMKPTPRRDLGKITTIDHTEIFGFHRQDQMEFLGGEDEARRCAFTADQIAQIIDAQSRKDLPSRLTIRQTMGPLATTNQRLNILYTVDGLGQLFAVYIGWSDGWHVVGGKPFLHTGYGWRLLCQKY